MPQVKVTGWRPGLNKVQMTTAIRDLAGLSLAEAKDCTDRTLLKQTVTIDMDTPERAQQLADALTGLGAEVAVMSEES